MVRPSDKANYKSWVVKWEGNKPVLKQSVFTAEYTEGHQETPEMAISVEIVHLLQNIKDFREKWLNINLLAEQQKHNVESDAFGQVQIKETDDPHEKMTMPANAVDVPPEGMENAFDPWIGATDEEVDANTIPPLQHDLPMNDLVDYGGWEDH